MHTCLGNVSMFVYGTVHIYVCPLTSTFCSTLSSPVIVKSCSCNSVACSVSGVTRTPGTNFNDITSDKPFGSWACRATEQPLHKYAHEQKMENKIKAAYLQIEVDIISLHNTEYFIEIRRQFNLTRIASGVGLEYGRYRIMFE